MKKIHARDESGQGQALRERGMHQTHAEHRFHTALESTKVHERERADREGDGPVTEAEGETHHAHAQPDMTAQRQREENGRHVASRARQRREAGPDQVGQDGVHLEGRMTGRRAEHPVRYAQAVSERLLELARQEVMRSPVSCPPAHAGRSTPEDPEAEGAKRQNEDPGGRARQAFLGRGAGEHGRRILRGWDAAPTDRATLACVD